MISAASLSTQAGLIIGGGGLVFLVVGLGFVVAGRRAGQRRAQFESQAQAVQAEVVDNVWHDIGVTEVSLLAFAVLRYRLPDGTVLEQESFEGRSPPIARKGRTVTALYDPADPRRVRVARASVLPAVFMVFGGVFALSGALMVAGAGALLVV